MKKKTIYEFKFRQHFFNVLLDVDSKVIANGTARFDYWLELAFYICSVEVAFVGRPGHEESWCIQ
jgi:hypothetical protein